MTVSPLLTVFRLLAGTAAAMSPSDILLLLGFGLHLAVVLGLVASTSEAYAVFENILKVVHSLMMEKSDSCECHCDTVFVAGLNHIVITY